MKRFAGILSLTLLCACSSPKPEPLPAGYFGMEGPGFYSRLILYPGQRRIAYDIWHVSETPYDNSKHAHYDLIGDSPTPMSGKYAVTRDGADCGSAWLERYKENGKPVGTILVLRIGGDAEPFGGGNEIRSAGDYAMEDRAIEYRVASEAAEHPTLFRDANYRTKYYIEAMRPECSL